MAELKPQVKRKKPAPNLSPDELDTLLNSASMHSPILSQKYGTEVTKESKNKIWAEISSQVSSIGKCPRSPRACKKNWHNSRSAATSKVRNFLRESRKTGI